MNTEMTGMNPTREDFAALLEESFITHDVLEGEVVKGTVTAIEKDLAVIDVGLKVEGRVPLKEFGLNAKDGGLKPGDEVEVFVERVENAMGEAVLSRGRCECGGVPRYPRLDAFSAVAFLSQKFALPIPVARQLRQFKANAHSAFSSFEPSSFNFPIVEQK